jgi:hypothetical protein
LLRNPESGQHIQSVFTRYVYCSLVCKHHCVEFMNSCFLLAQRNRSCFLIGSLDGELIYTCLAQVTFLVLVLVLPLLLPLKQCARRRDIVAVFMGPIPALNDVQFTFRTVVTVLKLRLCIQCVNNRKCVPAHCNTQPEVLSVLR